MLIEKSYEKNQIVSIKLVSGDEIIAKVVEDNEQEYKLNKPLAVIMSDKGLAMLPYMISVAADEPLNLRKTHAMCVAKPVSEVEKHYIQITTGIAL